MLRTLTPVTDLSTATLVWMLQCISPHLTIDQEAFDGYLDQYNRWLTRIRFACTYHHQTTWENIKSYLPSIPYIPLINPAPSGIEPPKRDAPHAHPELDFSWGAGPLVDSFGGMYHLNGTHTRMPGHEDAETYDAAAKEYKWSPIRALGRTNEYIHPITYHRSLVHGWDAHSPLQKGWKRKAERGADGKARFWWYMHGEEKKIELPEWAILPNLPGRPNFERQWYLKCEQSEGTRAKLSCVKEYGEKDFLEVLDEEIDFGFDNKPQNQWP
jgi:hypothetical protein